MTRIIRAVAAVAIAGGLAIAAAADQQPPDQAKSKIADPAVKKDGWWIRISPDIKADTITWQFSQPGGKDTKPVSFTWRRGSDPDNFDLPEAVRMVSPLAYVVTTQPEKAAGSFCLFNAANGVRRVTLPGRSATVTAKGRDRGCTP